jgi:hypothetical protein
MCVKLHCRNDLKSRWLWPGHQIVSSVVALLLHRRLMYTTTRHKCCWLHTIALTGWHIMACAVAMMSQAHNCPSLVMLTFLIIKSVEVPLHWWTTQSSRCRCMVLLHSSIIVVKCDALLSSLKDVCTVAYGWIKSALNAVARESIQSLNSEACKFCLEKVWQRVEWLSDEHNCRSPVLSSCCVGIEVWLETAFVLAWPSQLHNPL